MRNLILVFGDQLNRDSMAFDALDPAKDVVWMAEVAEEATYVWSHKLRIAFFFSAMRHFRDALQAEGITVHYHELSVRPSEDRGNNFGELLRKDVRKLRPERLIAVRPGDHRVLTSIQEVAKALEKRIEFRPDTHFYCSVEEFASLSRNKRSLLMETFYRQMRKRHRVLIEQDGKPTGGQWNLDRENREAFGRGGPRKVSSPRRFRPDTTTTKVIKMVSTRFADHPGCLDHFQLPVTRRDAQTMLRHFIAHGLPQFGRFEDAMWTNQPFLFHSRLSALLNLKLLNPRECVDAAVEAYDSGAAPLNSVEGFIRQILGWREYIRGIYWRHMPDYADMNHLDVNLDVPPFFWDGETDMACVGEAMRHVLDHGYAHHIERLMVLGLLAQLLGVHPRRFHDWHMAMYVDAVDWVSLPNTLGMSQYGDGGIVGTKPYCATGNYIHRMSNFCRSCRYAYKDAVGEDACPITTLYWDFLDRHYDRLNSNPRMGFQTKNLARKREKIAEMKAIRAQAAALRARWYS